MPLPAPNGTKRSNATEIEDDTDELIPLAKIVEFLEKLDENGNTKRKMEVEVASFPPLLQFLSLLEVIATHYEDDPSPGDISGVSPLAVVDEPCQEP